MGEIKEVMGRYINILWNLPAHHCMSGCAKKQTGMGNEVLFQLEVELEGK